MCSQIDDLRLKAIHNKGIVLKDAVALYDYAQKKPLFVIAVASEIREHFKGKVISLCSIINAKSGRCAEDCKFCAQSAFYKTGVETYGLISAEEMVKAACVAKEKGAHMFGVVTSGTRITTEKEWEEIYRAVKGITMLGLRPCASLGMLTDDNAKRLKENGLWRYHHNLETSRSFFKNVCTTHEYEDDIATLKAAQQAGLSTCSGGIIGLGENMDHRIELAMTLRELGVDSIPLNILNPIPQTPLEKMDALSPMEILITIAIFRFILPDKDIKLCGGKEKNLRQLLPLGIAAGCNSMMTGNYLTTAGRDTALDIEMINDLGFTAVIEGD